MLEIKKRSLSDKERRYLLASISKLDRFARGIKIRIIITTLIVYGLLWVATSLLSDAPWPVVTFFWVCLGTGMGVWMITGERRKISRRKEWIEAALSRNEAEVAHIRSSEMVEFEEIEDEGAAYAFQVDGDIVVFVEGQDFYPSARFPNTDFEVIRIYGRDDEMAEMLIEKHGEKLRPVRRISARVKRTLSLPGHLKTVRGRLAELERILRAG
jgi:hypothetical protein